jgi:hypothetical protein
MYLYIYIYIYGDQLILTKWVTKVKPGVLTQLSFIHNRVKITCIQWMVRLWVAGSPWRTWSGATNILWTGNVNRAPFVRDDHARHKCRTTRTLSSLRRTTDVIRVSCCSGALLLGMLLRICSLILKGGPLWSFLCLWNSLFSVSGALCFFL